ncbi:MAG: orotidine 5'-phosphate decarboxylase / HUMPS family protein [Patescibacteria group bacterium]|jgi:orotidine-5'-phosphate decarboxylase
MKRKVIILPLDGISGAVQLLSKLNDLLDSPGLEESLAYIKLNDGVHNVDAGGPFIVSRVKNILRSRNLSAGIFLDLKIYDVSATLVNTLKKYSLSSPDILTVSSACSVEGIMELRKLLPEIKLAMISTPTDISKSECLTRFGQSPEVKIYNDLMNIREVCFSKLGDQNKSEPFDLVVCSPHELPFLKRNLPDSYGFIVPGIRDVWMTKIDEHQKRITGVRKALDSGATYVVMGAQMTKGNPERDVSPEKSRLLTKNEIELARGRLVVPGDPL